MRSVLFSGDVATAGLLRPPPSRRRLVLSFATLVALIAVTLFAAIFFPIFVHGVLLFWAAQRRRGRPRMEQVGGHACTVLPNARGLFAMVAIVFGSFLVDVAMGRLTAGYVALSPDGVRQRGRSLESFLPWDSVHRVLRVHVDVPTVIINGYPGAVWERRRTSLWKIDRFPNMVAVDVDGGTSALPPALVLDALAFYVAHPRARAELGTPAAIARFADWSPEQGGPR
jgi:hypothetical protein